MSALWMEVVIEFPELFYIQQVDLMKQTQENQFYEQLEGMRKVRIRCRRRMLISSR